MTTPRLVLGVHAALLLLALGEGLLSWALAGVCLAALVVIGELWLRALTGEAMPPAHRIGLACAAGLVSLPFVALTLHVCGVLIEARSVAAGLAVLATLLGAVVLVRERGASAPADPRLPRMIGAVVLPGLLTLVVGFLALQAYGRLPHPPQPGYTSLALSGWAAGIERPVSIPARGVRVPLLVSSTGKPAATEPLRVRVGGRLVSGRPMTVKPDVTRAVDVLVPAPPDGCVHRIEISLGPASTVFYGRGPATC
ncbi:hypothetical protein [Paractinoplanes brasiliensis]|uniref:Uncharacterized protein n=1 Tax=Paractinoplanes brasiliensis TaxID=52695 RepID=A0A4R6JWH8_9ACTN|nr:hypothetical protein [Actinoplanes brasiliensis]TDO41039.1 hypothetical protein C8E87_4765 [Actinoplanes brasiliensis]GID26107.1 hypothetical protein Abr02nite_10900 [Actinoplanes brasiliensis]